MEDENLTTNGNEESLSPQDTDTEIELDLGDEEEIDWRAEAEKKETLANNYKIRAEKAEKLNKQFKPEVNTVEAKEHSNLSTIDTIAIMKADVDNEDIERVINFAKSENMSVQEALKNDELKAILDVRKEKRNVAQASHSGASRRSSSKISDDALLSRASKGEAPESEDEIRRLNNLRWSKKD